MAAVEYTLIPTDTFRDTLEEIRVEAYSLDPVTMAYKAGIEPDRYIDLERIRSRYEPRPQPALEELQEWAKGWELPQILTNRLIKSAGYQT